MVQCYFICRYELFTLSAAKAAGISYLVLYFNFLKTSINCAKLFSVTRQLQCYTFIELRPWLNVVFVSACFVRISFMLMISEYLWIIFFSFTYFEWDPVFPLIINNNLDSLNIVHIGPSTLLEIWGTNFLLLSVNLFDILKSFSLWLFWIVMYSKLKHLGKENNISKFKNSLPSICQPKECCNENCMSTFQVIEHLKEFKDFNIVSLKEKFPERDWCFPEYRHNFNSYELKYSIWDKFVWSKMAKHTLDQHTVPKGWDRL